MSYALDLYKRLNGRYRQALKYAPQIVEKEMESLGDLIVELAPFVGSDATPFDASKKPKLDEYLSILPKMQELGKSPKVKKLFVDNGLDSVLKLAGSSLNSTNDEGDIILLQICYRCGEIADKILAS
jgi:hypothetical protein